MRLRTLAVAALAAMTLAACSKDGKEGSDGPDFEGGKASMRLSFTLPTSPGTRAGNDGSVEGTTAENAITSVSVYVFNESGTLPASGAYNSYVKADFAESGNTYTLRNSIQTTAGNKKIYIATNLPAALDGAVANENELLSKLATVETQLLNGGSGALTSLVMFSMVKDNLKEAGSDDYVNTVSADMDRAVARVAASTSGSDVKAGGIVEADFVIDGTNDLKMEYTIKNYFITQDAYSSYLAPRFDATGRAKSLIHDKAFDDRGQVINIYNPAAYDKDVPALNVPYKSIAREPATLTGMDGFYIGENIPTHADQLALYGSATYAFIQTTVDVNKTAVVDDPSTPTKIEYTGVKIIGGTDDLHLVRVENSQTGKPELSFICAKDNSDAVIAFLESEYPTSDVNRYVYGGAYVYYMVYLNATSNSVADALDKYNVLRNHFIHIDITGVKGSSITDGFGGYPGDKEDPTKPIDPTDPTDPNNPDPIDPIDPIDEISANLIVKITVKEWDYMKNTTILE